ncbi:hypothetical protein NKG94_28545 [Micromonospora sp. M12]
MFFIFGLRTKVDRSGVVQQVCRHCGNQAAQVITRRSTKFTLFFIPSFRSAPATRSSARSAGRSTRSPGPRPSASRSADPRWTVSSAG